MARVTGITQARIGSSRLPGKILLPLTDTESLLEVHLTRLKKAATIDQWIVATTEEAEAVKIAVIARQFGITTYHGSTENVLDRFYQALSDIEADYVVRVTSDCPLIDPAVIDETVTYCIEHQLHYYTNVINGPFPDGADVEVFRFSALHDAWQNATSKSDQEHVTPFIRQKYPVTGWHGNEPDFSHLRLTVDEQADLDLLRRLVAIVGTNDSWLEYCQYLQLHPEIAGINQHLFRNQGYMKSKFEEIQLRSITQSTQSDVYRKRIHDLIPGGAHTYSKGDDQFPERSPAAITHGKDAHVWDVDGNEFLDCSMGLTSVSLGHAYTPVVEAVSAELQNGVNFQRPAFLELEMAETFLNLVPQHDMIKFAKNGSVVTTAAVKLARAKTGRKLIAFPADHPFYSYDDWFIGKTPCNQGIPQEIGAFSVTFQSCNLDSLKSLFEQYPNEIACVITEPEKLNCGSGCSCGNDPGSFLKQAIDLAHKHGALFIIDEMITGFKTSFPGSITKYNLEPDMATWGKGIANGFSFCALTGKKEVMELGGIRNTGAEKVFLISTTHGGETHAMAAAIATIKIFREQNVTANNLVKGKQLIELCQERIRLHEMEDFVQIIPCPWMVGFVFKDKQQTVSPEFRTLFLQEMIRHGVLFQGIFVPCHTHTENDLYYFTKAFDASLITYKSALNEGVENYLSGKAVKAVFRKYL
jgi:spore coat polysaccharide biosynthesis protein SpsF